MSKPVFALHFYHAIQQREKLSGERNNHHFERLPMFCMGVRSAIISGSFQYEYDELDRVTRLRENTSNMVTQNYYRSGMPNRTAHIDHFNLRVTGYDKALRPTQMTLDVFHDGMTHDLTEDFAYNPASQVTEYTVDITDYLYTGNDNLDGDYTVNGLNQYTDVDGETYDYDDKGNLTDIGTDDYGYDSLNRMTSALGVSLKYDPYGRLYEIDTGSAVTRFVYDGDAMVLELDGNNTIQGRYVHGPGVDQPLVWYDGSSVGATERRHLAADRQGSIIAVSTSTTSAPHINSYDVFGIPDAGNLGRFSYTGQIWLPEIGLMYYKARIYNPQLGRFMQTDPIGYDDQMNMYAYVGNDPMNATDPTGMQEFIFEHEARIQDLHDSGYTDYQIQKQINEDHKLGITVVGPVALLFVPDPTDIALAGIVVGTVKVGTKVSKIGKTTAASANASHALNRKLSTLQTAQSNSIATKTLPDGRIRYYFPEKPARTEGPTRGSAYVTEHNPKTGQVRSWYESYDHNGNVNRVNPKLIDGQKVDSQHYPPTGRELNK